jgi:hypothetical protein
VKKQVSKRSPCLRLINENSCQFTGYFAYGKPSHHFFFSTQHIGRTHTHTHTEMPELSGCLDPTQNCSTQKQKILTWRKGWLFPYKGATSYLVEFGCSVQCTIFPPPPKESTLQGAHLICMPAGFCGELRIKTKPPWAVTILGHTSNTVRLGALENEPREEGGFRGLKNWGWREETSKGRAQSLKGIGPASPFWSGSWQQGLTWTNELLLINDSLVCFCS